MNIQKLKRFLFAFLLVIMAGTTLIGCKDSKKTRTFTVGFDADFPPYCIVEKDGYTGFDIELAKEVAKRRNWNIKLKAINWDAKDMELNSGLIDCIWNGFTINGRENSYTWSPPYTDNKQVAVVNNQSTIQTLADLAGKKVAVQMDTPMHKALLPEGKCGKLGKTFAKLVVTPNYNNAFMELQAGSVDAIAVDIGVARQKMTGNKRFRILKEVIMNEFYGIGFKKGNTQLRDEVVVTLSQIMKDGTAAQISQKYFNADVIIPFAEAAVAESAKKVEGKTNQISNFYATVKMLADGLKVTLIIFFSTLIFAIPIGVIVAKFRMSKNFVVRNVFICYISVMRGTPLMLQLLVWFFCPYFLFGLPLSELGFMGLEYRYIAVIVGFSLNYAAYFAEIYRAGIESIPKGQYEAAKVLGYSDYQCASRIILPQVVKRILPPMTNEVITLVKDTSLAFSLSVLEMFTVAKQIASAQSTMMPFIVAGVFYYILNFLVASFMSYLEKRLNYYR